MWNFCVFLILSLSIIYYSFSIFLFLSLFSLSVWLTVHLLIVCLMFLNMWCFVSLSLLFSLNPLSYVKSHKFLFPSLFSPSVFDWLLVSLMFAYYVLCLSYSLFIHYLLFSLNISLSLSLFSPSVFDWLCICSLYV